MYPNNSEAFNPKSVSPPPPSFPPPQKQFPEGQWSTGLYDCCDDPSNCFITCCCPCITFGRIAEIVDRGAISCKVAGLIYYALGTVGCGWLYGCTYRSKLRGLFSLPEDPCTDCLLHWGVSIIKHIRGLDSGTSPPYSSNCREVSQGPQS
ncbi:hypothetical protein L1049_006189 [Liquidambar formosana]|uniref:Uncharacterized protein n=1 Tax=Liquidambar formosana TaxID=63359 RepID=A0AAP0WTG6_LIQFO